MDVHLRDLRYFVAVAEELHFSRAAERLHLDQPTLSRHIRRLEAQLGVELLQRTTRSVALTNAGATFLEEARKAIEAADAAANTAREAAAGRAGVLRIGMMAQIASELRVCAIASFEARYPNVEIRPIGGHPYVEPTCGLASGETDVAFVWEPIVNPKIETLKLFDEPRYIVCAVDHPLAARDVLTLDDIHDERVFGFPEEYYEDPAVAAWADFHQLQPRPDGSRRPIGARVANRDEWVDALIRGCAISPTPYSTATYYDWPGVVFIPIEGVEPATISLAWHRESGNPLVASFVAVVREVRPVTA